MEMLIYNLLKHRLETIVVEVTKRNTTWFDDNVGIENRIIQVTDFKGGIIIKRDCYEYPLWIGDVTREEIDHSDDKVEKLLINYM